MDPYKILGIDKGADLAAIKMAYRAMAKKHHPDCGGDVRDFRLIQEAYEILIGKRKKKKKKPKASSGQAAGDDFNNGAEGAETTPPPPDFWFSDLDEFTKAEPSSERPPPKTSRGHGLFGKVLSGMTRVLNRRQRASSHFHGRSKSKVKSRDDLRTVWVRSIIAVSFTATLLVAAFTAYKLSGDPSAFQGEFEPVSTETPVAPESLAGNSKDSEEFSAAEPSALSRSSEQSLFSIQKSEDEFPDSAPKSFPLSSEQSLFPAQIRRDSGASLSNSSVPTPQPNLGAGSPSANLMVRPRPSVSLDSNQSSMNFSGSQKGLSNVDGNASAVRWTPLRPISVKSLKGASLTLKDDLSILASGSRPDTDTYVLAFSEIPAGVTAFRLEVLPDNSLPRRGPGRFDNGNFVLTEFRGEIRDANFKTNSLRFMNPTASYEQTQVVQRDHPYGRWTVAGALDKDARGELWGWAIREQVGQPQFAIFETATDLSLDKHSELRIMLDQNYGQHPIGRFRLSATSSPRSALGIGAEAAGAVGRKEGVNLLDDLALDTAKKWGTWRRTPSGLRSGNEQACRLEIADAPKGEYDLIMTFTPSVDKACVAPCCWTFGTGVNCDFGGWEGTTTAFQLVDGKPGIENKSAKRSRSPNGWLTKGKLHKVRIQVRKDSLAAYLDGELVTKFNTDYRNVRYRPDWAIGAGKLGIGSWASPTTFHEVRYELVGDR